MKREKVWVLYPLEVDLYPKDEEMRVGTLTFPNNIQVGEYIAKGGITMRSEKEAFTVLSVLRKLYSCIWIGISE